MILVILLTDVSIMMILLCIGMSMINIISMVLVNNWNHM